MTRLPRCRDSATFSAACRQTLQRRNSVSPSFHSLELRSKVRGVEATVKFATAAPAGVKRSSGSSVTLPTTVMTVSPAIFPPALLLIRTDDLGPQHGLVEPQLSVQFRHCRRVSSDVEYGVDALGLVVDLVGEPTSAPHIDLLNGPAALPDDGEHLIKRRPDGLFLEIGIEDDHELVATQARHKGSCPPLD